MGYCTKTTAKGFLLAINFVLMVCGGGIAALGYITKNGNDEMLGILELIPSSHAEKLQDNMEKASLLDQAAAIVMYCGIGIVVIALTAYIGACWGSVLILYLYIAVVVVLVLIQIGAVIMVVMYTQKVFDFLEGYLNNTIAEEYNGGELDNDGNYQQSNNTFAMLWDLTMVRFQCCGNMNYSDFKVYASNWKGNIDANDTSIVPITCCKTTDDTRNNFPKKVDFIDSADCLATASSESTNRQGCYSLLLDDVTYYKNLVVYGCVGMIALQIIAILSAAVVISYIKQQA